MAKPTHYYTLYKKYIKNNDTLLELGLYHGSSIEKFTKTFPTINYIGVDIFEACRNNYMIPHFEEMLNKHRQENINNYFLVNKYDKNTKDNLWQEYGKDFTYSNFNIHSISHALYKNMCKQFENNKNVNLIRGSLGFIDNADLKNRFISTLEEPYEEHDGLLYIIDSIKNITDSVNIIIDDASHRKEDQQISFGKLFKLLNKGGYYIIEDLQCKRFNRYVKERAPLDTIDFFKLFNDKKELHTNMISDEDKKYIIDNVDNIQFYRNDIVIIKKKD